MKQIRRITKSGGLTIPRGLRVELGLPPGAPVELTVNEGGKLEISTHIPVCHICGNADKLTTVNGITLCRECIGTFERGWTHNG